MRKLWLITLSLVMAVLLCLGLIACGDKTVEQITNEFGALLEGGNFKEGSVLNIDNITDEKATEILSKLEESGITIDDETKAYIYDIFVTKDDAEVQPDGTVKLTIPAPEDEKAEGYNVYHMKDNDAVEVIPSTYKDGKVSFETDSFSAYIFTPTYNCVVSGILDSDVTGIVVDVDNTVVYDPNGDTPLPNFESVKVTAVAPNGTFALSADKYTVDLGGLDATKPGNYTVTYTYVKDTAIKHTVNVTVLAEAVTVTVENDGRGGTADHLGVNRIEKGSALTLNAELYGDDFIFLGWYLEDGTLLSDEISYSFTANEDTVILARFKDKNVATIKVAGIIDHMINSDRLSIFLNGSNIKQNKNEFYIGELISLELRNAPAGYVFLGWYEKDVDHEFNHDLPDDIAPVMKKTPLSTQHKFEYEITSDTVEIYAVFAHEGQQFILDASHSDAAIFKDKSGAELEFPLFEKFKSGKTYTLTVEPKEGYEFIGWYIDEQYDHQVKNDTTLTYTTNLYSVAVHAEFKPVVTDLVVDMDDVTYYPDLLKQYTLIGIPEFIEICKEGKTGENWNTEYMVVGTIKSISNTTWGNMYIADGEGNELHLYGVYDENGTRYGLLNSKPRVGDTIAIHGTPYLYNNHPEMQKACLLNEMPVLPDFENVTVSSVTADGTTKLSADEFTVDASAVNPDKPGEYAVVYTYKANPEIKATVTVKVIATPVCLNAWVNGGTILIDGVDVGPDYFEEFTDGFGKITLTAVGEENTVFKGWYNSGDNSRTPISTDATYTFEFDKNTYVYAEFEYTATEIWLDGMNMGFDTVGGITNIYLPVQGTYDPNSILVFALINGEREALTADEYTIDLGGFNGASPAKGDYVLTFAYKANPELKATHIIRVLDEENMAWLDVSCDAGGRVIQDKPYNEFNKGEQVTLTVELRSEKDYEFLGWYTVDASGAIGDRVSTDRTYTVTLNESTYLIAKIAPKVTYLDVVVGGYPTNPAKIPLEKFSFDVNVYACGALGLRNELTAADYTVDMGGLNLTNPVVGKYTITYTYKADTSIKYELVVWVWNEDHSFRAYTNSPDCGDILFEGGIAEAAGGQYIDGEEITVTAIERDGFAFLGWYKVINKGTYEDFELITTEQVYTFVIDADTTIMAKFDSPVTEIWLDGNVFSTQNGQNVINIPRGQQISLDGITVYGTTFLGDVALDADDYTVDLGGLDLNNPAAGSYMITYTYKENTEITACIYVTVWTPTYVVKVEQYHDSEYVSGLFEYEGNKHLDLYLEVEEGKTVILKAVEKPNYTFVGWYATDYNNYGEWEIYSTDATVAVKAESDIILAPVYMPLIVGLQIHEKADVYEAGVMNYEFSGATFGSWDEELGCYVAYGNIDLYANSKYATDIGKFFENFNIISVDSNGYHRQISHEALTIDLGDYKAEEGWYEIKVSYGSFTMIVNVMVLPAENA